MSKRLILILAFAFVVAMSFTAYAEVQNVKVSGDITALGVYRNNLDLAKTPTSGSNVIGLASGVNNFDDKAEFLASIVRLRVDADLTDNVIATVRLLNERDWNGDVAAGTGVANNNIGLNNAVAAGNSVSVTVDLAYVTLKEFLYSPLTLRVGRQELRFNNGWMVGDPNTNVVATLTGLAGGDLSAHKAFDAIRATLDYNPLVIDLFSAKIAEAIETRNDDITLSGINASYELRKDTTVEGFFYSKVRGSQSAAVTNTDSGNATSFNSGSGALTKNKADVVNAVGARVVNKTVKNLTLDVQGAFQFGTYNPKFDVNARYDGVTNAQTANRRAFGVEAVGIYDLKDIAAIAKYHPMLMGAFVYLSGEHRRRVGDNTYHGWDPMAEDQTFGHLINAMFGFSNIKIGGLSLQAKPTDDTSVKVDYVGGWWNKKFVQGDVVNLSGVNGARSFTLGSQGFVGQEIDGTVTYDYTEDVQFSLLGGIFLPGKSINPTTSDANPAMNFKPHRAAATELIGSMKVTF